MQAAEHLIVFTRRWMPVVAATISAALGSAPGEAEAQANPPPNATSFAPMLGGQLPPPNFPITITWDPRFKPEQTFAARVGEYLVIEGDMIVGTVADVDKARLNGLIARAQRFRARPVDLGKLPKEIQDTALDVVRQVAEQAPEPTTLTAPGSAEADLVRLLREIQQFKSDRSALRSRAPEVPGVGLSKAAADALEKFEAANRKLATDPVAPPPPGDPSQSFEQSLSFATTPQYYWPNGVVPYYIDPSYEPYRGSFMSAIALWTSKTNAVSFRPYQAGDRNYLYVQLITGDAGSSFVGMIPNSGQRMALVSPDRFPPERIAHELGHALGLFHEQSRPDRATFLTLIENNIAQGWLSQFTTPTQQPFTTLGSGFDYFSIMLYDSRAGSTFPQFGFPTPSFPVYSIPQYWKDEFMRLYRFRLDTDVIGLGNVKEPSRDDVNAINLMYRGPARAAAMAGAAAPAAVAIVPAPGPADVAPPPGPAFPDQPATVGPALMGAASPPQAPASGPATSVATTSIGGTNGPAITVTVSIPLGALPTAAPTPTGETGPVTPISLPPGVLAPVAPPGFQPPAPAPAPAPAPVPAPAPPPSGGSPPPTPGATAPPSATAPPPPSPR